MVPVATIRGAPTLEPREFAEAIAAESRRVLDATRNGTPLPDYQHSLHDLRLLFAAVNGYAKANKGQLPPDLGAALPFLSEDELPTAADKARVYLSPRSERVLHVPEELTADWINKNASYVYLAAGAPPITLKAIKDRSDAIILHGPIDESYTINTPGIARRVVPMVDSFESIMSGDSEWIKLKIAESTDEFKAIRGK